MQISGYNGSSADAGFKNYFDISSTSLTNKGCSSASCSVTEGEFIFIWVMDNASIPFKIKLFQADAATLIASVDIVYSTTNNSNVYYEVHLTDVKVKTISQVGDSTDNLKEQVSFLYKTISWKAIDYNTDGTIASTSTSCNNVTMPKNSCAAVVFPF